MSSIFEVSLNENSKKYFSDIKTIYHFYSRKISFFTGGVFSILAGAGAGSIAFDQQHKKTLSGPFSNDFNKATKPIPTPGAISDGVISTTGSSVLQTYSTMVVHADKSSERSVPQQTSEKDKQFGAIAEQHSNPADFMTAAKFDAELPSFFQGLQPDNWCMADIDCGAGVQCHFFAKKFPGIKKIIGIEKSPGLLNVARKNYTDPCFSFIEGDLHNTPISDDTCDIVYSRLTLHYSTDMVAAFKEMARITKPGGKLYVSISHPIHELFLKPSHDYRNPENAIFSWIEQVTVEHGTHTFSEYVNAIIGAGLEISVVKEENHAAMDSGHKIPKRLIFELTKTPKLAPKLRP